MFYSYTPSADQMLTLSELNNVLFYGQYIQPTGEFYYESFVGTYYIQAHAGTEYVLEIQKGWASPSSFKFDHYDCAFPDGSSWSTAIQPIDKFTYVPITGSLPSYLCYTAPKDGLLEMKFNSYITLSCSDSPNGTFNSVKTSYENNGYRGTMPVEAGKTYYFQLTAYSSPLCYFDVLEIKDGQSADAPYILENGSTGKFPKEAGKYYYKITNDKQSPILLIKGKESFDGTAQFSSTGFSYFSLESKNSIDIRTEVSQYYPEYYLLLTRDKDAAEDQTFTVNFSAEAYDSFPGETISEGQTTISAGSGKFYYTFNVPTDGRSIIKIDLVDTDDASSEAKTTAALYYSNNQYSSLANGTSIYYKNAVAGRDYTVVWNVAAGEAPVSFNLEFVAPPLGETFDNPIPAKLGENTAAGGSTVYFRYYATNDGWLIVKPADGLDAPSVSMLPTESDPFMQACDVIDNGDGAYRVASQKDRGYILIFNSATEINFTISELTALPGEAASNPFVVSGDTAEIPNDAAIYWFSYTAPRDGKLVITTNIPYQQSTNHQDYTYVQIYAPSDPDNRIAQLRPDYDLGKFDEKIIDTTNGTEYLVKVRTLVSAENQWVKFVVRDPSAGEIPTLPIEIPFDGKTGKYDFNRMVNYEADAIWYGITLPSGYFSLKGSSVGAFSLTLYAAADASKALAETKVLTTDYDETNEMYIYFNGIDGYHVTTPGKYLLKLSDNEVPVEASISMATSGISDAALSGATVRTIDGGVVLSSPTETTAHIYTIDGKLIDCVTFVGETTLNLTTGFYIVRIDHSVQKVAIK